MIAEAIRNNAFTPKNPKSKKVMGKFAQGEAKRNAITAGTDAPFLYN